MCDWLSSQYRIAGAADHLFRLLRVDLRGGASLSYDLFVDVIDPGLPPTWPGDVRDRVAELVERCRAVPTNEGIPAYELRLEHVDAAYEEELAFRGLLGDRPVALFHATRLLPHEVDVIREEGLLVVELEHRGRRLDRVIELYGDEVGVERLEALRVVYPLSDAEQRASRLGMLWGVTPLDAFSEDGDGLAPLLESWGGETFFWAAKDSDAHALAIAALTERSEPLIVEVGVIPREFNKYKALWKVFAAQLAGWREPWNEIYTTTSVPPERVVSFIGRDDPRWPYAPDDI